MFPFRAQDKKGTYIITFKKTSFWSLSVTKTCNVILHFEKHIILFGISNQTNYKRGVIISGKYSRESVGCNIK